MARFGKLYKLVKITRMVRLLKVVKSQGKVFSNLTDMFKLGEGFERFMSQFMIFLMMSHFIACLWIMTADLGSNNEVDKYGEEGEATNWILANGY